MTTFFIDTNVILYTYDLRQPVKQGQAAIWLSRIARRRLPTINLQVINEFCHVALRKLPELSADDIREQAALLREWGETPLDFDTLERAWDVRVETGYGWFDCTLLAAAQMLDCDVFLSEDMQHGRVLGPLTIINPFRVDPDAFLKAN